MNRSFARIADGIDLINAAAGRLASWCCLSVIAIEFAVVVMRYVFGIGSIAAQESVLYAASALFMLAAARTLQIDGHVRIDIFYQPATPRTRAIVDLVGSLVFLLPFAFVLALVSLPYVEHSWAILERSREASGLPFTYLLKTFILLFAVLLGLQGVAQIIRAVLVLSRPPIQAPR